MNYLNRLSRVVFVLLEIRQRCLILAEAERLPSGVRGLYPLQPNRSSQKAQPETSSQIG